MTPTLPTDILADAYSASSTADLAGWLLLAAILGYVLYGATKQ